LLQRAILRWTALAAILCLSAWQAGAQSLFDRLVMPGPLVEGHAKYEKDCKNCHEAFAKASQTRLCLTCHKDIAADREAKRGLHGLRPDAVNAECKHCHTEHQGRAADIVQFDRETFNHNLTDFKLNGSHTSVRCESCHAPKTKYRAAPGQCIDCHKKNDPHKGQLGEKCAGCHSEDAWRRVKPFDHSKTKFPLTGAHAEVTCNACHGGERYKGVSTVCSGCHQLQDVHRGRYGAKCDTCHQPKKWDVIRFDHDRQTKFPLRNKHAKAKCDACHTGDLYRDKLPATCVSCHKKDDPHKAQLGARCESCHSEAGWRQKVEFDHDLTHFPLIGLHALVPCEECHRTASYKDTSTKCADCHKDARHEGRLGTNCSLCHNPNGWTLWRFDHDKQTRYPLTGAHKKLDCHLCHRQKHVATISLSTSCYACHAADDVHQGNFGNTCDKCHTTQTFHPGGLRR
jgi:hypothetical protein